MNETDGVDDRELALLRRRDGQAFERLVRAHETIVAGLGQSMGFSGFDLDDAAAEVFAAVYLALPNFQGRSSLGTWVYRIACRTLWRLRRKRRPSVEPPDDPVDPNAEVPGAAMELHEENQRIWNAVAALEPRQAMVVELYYRRDWSIGQIAQALDCPENTVKTHLFRARRRLAQVLGRREVPS